MLTIVCPKRGLHVCERQIYLQSARLGFEPCEAYRDHDHEQVERDGRADRHVVDELQVDITGRPQLVDHVHGDRELDESSERKAGDHRAGDGDRVEPADVVLELLVLELDAKTKVLLVKLVPPRLSGVSWAVRQAVHSS